MSSSLFNRRQVAAGLAMALSGVGASAQSNFPNRPITLVSPYQAGGAADGIARAVAEAAARELGQPVVVESKPGAEGLVGSIDVKQAQPDGYRLLWGGAGSMMVATALRKSPPFDPVADFTPIAATVEFSFFLFVHPSFPAKDMKEFIAYAKANPGKITYATGNNQGTLTMADLARRYGLDMVRVQYKGEVAAATDLLTNRVQAMWSTLSMLPHAKEGKLRVLATTLPRRSPLLPEVPTVAEAGTPVAEFGGGWLGIYGPARLPRHVVDRLNPAFIKAFNDADVQQKLRNAGLMYTPVNTPQQLADYTRNQRDLYIRTIKELSIPQE